MSTFIEGDNKCASPYSGNDKITVKRTGCAPGEWVELQVPTNMIFTSTNGTETTSQSWGFKQADATGTVQFDFNASATDPVVDTKQANGWVLPAGTYQLKTKLFSDKTGASIEAVDFEIISEATASIQTAVANKVRGKKK